MLRSETKVKVQKDLRVVSYGLSELAKEKFVAQVFDGSILVHEERGDTRFSIEIAATDWIKENYEIPTFALKDPEEEIIEAPREYTKDEVRTMFLNAIKNSMDFWEDAGETKRDALDGLVFSILAMLDGDVVALPRFIVAPDPHPEDAEFLAKAGLNWFPENYANHVNCDLAGSLHEYWAQMEKGNE